jgi:hypothetical protein
LGVLPQIVRDFVALIHVTDIALPIVREYPGQIVFLKPRGGPRYAYWLTG